MRKVFKFQIRRALCPGRVRSCHHPSSHVPGCSFCSFYSFLSIHGAIGSKSVLPDGFLAAPWRIPGGSLVDCRYGSRLFFSCSRSGKTAFGRLRTDQSPQHMHYLCYLMHPWSNFPPHTIISDTPSKSPKEATS